MSKFLNLYHKIVDEDIQSDVVTRHFDFNDSTILPIDDSLFQIINETVKAVELTPVPDHVLYDICKSLKKQQNVYKISYKKIIEIICNSEYALSNVFSESLNKYANCISGNLYVILIDKNNVNETLKSLKKLKDEINDDNRFKQVLNVFSQITSDTQGLTIIKKDIQFEKYKDCFIFISNTNGWKDTLEHEFKHFIQRVCSFDKSLPKVFDSSDDIYEYVLGNDETIESLLVPFKEHSFNVHELMSLVKFLKIKLSKTEQHQSITSMIKFFIRQYETSNELFDVNHKKLSVSQIEGLPKDIRNVYRKKWLNSFLNHIQTYNIFNYKELKDYLNSSNRILTQNVKLQLMSLLYLYVKRLNLFKIDDILEKEFIEFKFRGV